MAPSQHHAPVLCVHSGTDSVRRGFHPQLLTSVSVSQVKPGWLLGGSTRVGRVGFEPTAT
ncbi:hypothetical protein BT69DRAFT_1291315 [Atractiella rhizophila]|nr:hypothetical protein BT69DRAFT_1291315 [Atractiella rhizophila]